MPGTRSRPAGLRIGDVVNGWALKSHANPDDPGTSSKHDPKVKRQNDVDLD